MGSKLNSTQLGFTPPYAVTSEDFVTGLEDLEILGAETIKTIGRMELLQRQYMNVNLQANQLLASSIPFTISINAQAPGSGSLCSAPPSPT
jgi:hypothetical protein